MVVRIKQELADLLQRDGTAATCCACDCVWFASTSWLGLARTTGGGLVWHDSLFLLFSANVFLSRNFQSPLPMPSLVVVVVTAVVYCCLEGFSSVSEAVGADVLDVHKKAEMKGEKDALYKSAGDVSVIVLPNPQHTHTHTYTHTTHVFCR